MKKKLRSIFAILTALIILGSLTACSGTESLSEETDPSEITPGI